jgi:hypothetical protein
LIADLPLNPSEAPSENSQSFSMFYYDSPDP